MKKLSAWLPVKCPRGQDLNLSLSKSKACVVILISPFCLSGVTNSLSNCILLKDNVLKEKVFKSQRRKALATSGPLRKTGGIFKMVLTTYPRGTQLLHYS